MKEWGTRKILLLAGSVAALWLGGRYLLPLLLPFFVGALVALAAEPVVGFAQKTCKFPRFLAAGLGVTLTLLVVLGLLATVASAAVRELGKVVAALPDMTQTVQSGVLRLQDWMVTAVQNTPETVRPMLTQGVLNTFGDGQVLVDQLAQQLPGLFGGFLGGLPDGALSVGTGVISAYMISGRLPKIRAYLQSLRSKASQNRYAKALFRIRRTVWGWAKAQGKLMAVTYGIVAAGFLLLRIPHALLWAAAVALVDALPILGTGTVLIPWSLVLLLQQEYYAAAGMLGVYLAAVVTRSVLEPKLVGHQLGLDPLVTLLACYCGYRLWGVLGMITAPVAAAAVKSFFADQEVES